MGKSITRRGITRGILWTACLAIIAFWLAFSLAAFITGAERSGKWPAVQKAHVLREPACAACGSTAKVNVHHVRPFHLFPASELDDGNLITLCESGANGIPNCHLLIGHLGCFKYWNPDARADAAYWQTALGKNPRAWLEKSPVDAAMWSAKIAASRARYESEKDAAE